MAEPGVVAVVAANSDRLAASLVGRLRARELAVVACEPHELADRKILLDANRVEWQGAPVGAVVWRVPPGVPLSASFTAEDRAFADSETGAAWLAALSVPSVWAVNRYSAAVWYGGREWPAWQAWLRRHGVPVSSLRLGAKASREAHWRPFLSSDTRPAPEESAAKAMGIATATAYAASSVLVVAGEIMGSAPPSRGARAAADALTASGVVLARLSLDGDDRVLAVDTIPDFRRGDELLPVVDRLSEAIHERLHPR